MRMIIINKWNLFFFLQMYMENIKKNYLSDSVIVLIFILKLKNEM